uniref:hypothetical protein n=1 Tax=Acetatifactor sp. TaxID=1872090 RepID=UPI0040560009
MKKLKLRYYLRGLGIGILVTALILGFVGGDGAEMTDAQIRERALELGMVDAESIVLSDLRGNSTAESESVVDEQIPESTEPSESAESESMDESEVDSLEVTEETESVEQTENSEVIESTETAEDTESGESMEPTESTEEEDAVNEDMVTSQQSDDVVTITIYSGAHSYTVSKELEAIGLVADAKAFDNYLCNIGYSRYVRTGTYKITVGTSEEEIAKIITGKR